MAYNLGTAQGNIRIEYDSRGVARARNDLGQFVSLSELFGDSVDRDSDRASRAWLGFAGTLAKAVTVILAAGAAANLLNGAILGVVAVAQSFVPIITAGLATLPGVVLAAVAGFAVLKAALLGVADAFKAAFEDQAKFEEAIKNLAPQAQAAAKAFRSIVPELKFVQQILQDAVFRDTAPLFAQIGASVRGLVEEATGVGDAFNGILKEVLKFANSTVFIEAVRSSLTGLGQFLNALAPAFAPLLAGFSQLAGQAGQFFAAFGEKAAAALSSFGEFLGSLNLTDMWATAGAAVQNLMDLFSSFGEIIGAVVRAFTGAGQGMDDLSSSAAPLSNSLGLVVGKLAEFFNSAQGTEILNALAMAMSSVASVGGDVLMSLLSALAPVFAELGPLIRSLAQALGPILGAAFAAISPLLTTVANALRTGLGPVLPRIVDAFTSLAPVVGQVAGVLGGILAPLIQGLAPIIGRLAEAFSGILVAALQAVLPALQNYVPIFSQLALEMLPTLIPLIEELAQLFISLAPAAAMMVNALLPLVTDIMQAFAPAIMGAITVLTMFISVLANVVNWIVQIVTRFNVLGTIVGIVGAVVRAVGALFQWLYDLLIGNSIIPDLVNGMLMWFRMAVSGAIAVWSALTGALAAIWNGIKAVAEAAWNAVVSAVRNAVSNARAALSALSAIPGIVGGYFRSMVSAVSSAVGSLLGVVRGIPGQVRGALGNLGGLLYDAGRSIIQGLVNGIRSMIGAVSSAVSSVMSAARDLLPFSPAKKGPFSGRGWTLYSGRSMMTDLARGIEQAAPAVERAIEGVTGMVPTQLASSIETNASASGYAMTTGAYGTVPVTNTPIAPAVPVSSGITVNQTVNALPGQSAKQVGDSAVQRLVFGVVTGTSGLGATASAPGVA